jgi:hypothetical protein
MRQDRFLTGILIFIGLLVILAVSLFFIRQRGQQSYGPEDTPDGVVRNYILALQKEDYPRAYTYLAENVAQGSERGFSLGIASNAETITLTAIEIGSTRRISADSATVSLDIVQNQDSLFSNAYRQSQIATLTRENGKWKIVAMPYPFWSFDLQPAAPDKVVPTP